MRTVRSSGTNSFCPAGKPAALRLQADRDTITTTQGSVAHVRFEIVDSAGVVVPTANDLVRFTLAGAGSVALDNADLRDLEPYRSDQRHAFNGRGLAVIRAAQPGTLVLSASADGLPPARIAIRVVRGTAWVLVPAAR